MSLVDSPWLWLNILRRAPKVASKPSEMIIQKAKRGFFSTTSLREVCSAIFVIYLVPKIQFTV